MNRRPRLTSTVRLVRGDQLLATLTLAGADQPFFNARFEPTWAFQGVAPLFADELRLLNVPGDRFDADVWSAAYERIDSLGRRLVTEEGTEISEFLLHVDGDRAWFRY